MDRRCFIAFTGIAATAAPTGRAYPSDTGVRWRPDGVGSLARIGILTPDFDPVPESEFWAMAPHGVSIHVARVPRKGAEAYYAAPNIDEAVEQLVAVAPRVIVSAYTSSSYLLGANADDLLRIRLQNRAPGIPVILTCQVASEALRIMNIRRVALVHPPWFTEEMNAKGQDYFRGQGFEVVHSSRISPSRPFTEVSPQEVYEWTRMNVPRNAQGVFIAGNGLRAVGAIDALEKILHRPVLTANQVAFWGALRNVRLTSKLAWYGKIFAARATQIGNSGLAR